MPRVLIAGCGYVGQATADLLHERGWKLEGWTGSPQSARQLDAKPYSVRAVNIADLSAVSAVREEFDVVIQCASSGGGDAVAYRRVYLEGARNLLHAFPRARLLMTSSTSVYAQQQGDVVDETSPANPPHERGQILRETEEYVLSHNGIVARLGGIYGPGRSFFLRMFLEGKARSEDAGDRYVNQAHRDDIASALCLLAEQRANSGGQIYNLVDDEPILARNACQWLSTRLERPLPVATEKVVRERKRGASNKRVSNQKLHALGWAPRYPNFEVAMVESVLPSFGFER